MPVYFQRGPKQKRFTVAVFTEAEARAHDSEAVRAFKPWQDTTAAGEYAFSDDGYVLEVLLVRVYKPLAKTRTVYRRYAIGRNMIGYRLHADGVRRVAGNPTFFVGPYLEKGGASGMVAGSWREQEAKKGRAKRAAKLYAVLWLAKLGRLTDDDWHRIGLVYRNNQTIPSATARVFLKTQEGQALINQELALLLGMSAVTQEEINDHLRDVLKVAVNTGKLSNALDVIDRLQQVALGVPGGTKVDGYPPDQGGGYLDGFGVEPDAVLIGGDAASPLPALPEHTDAQFEELGDDPGADHSGDTSYQLAP
jgi:hypothetical protein